MKLRIVDDSLTQTVALPWAVGGGDEDQSDRYPNPKSESVSAAQR